MKLFVVLWKSEKDKYLHLIYKDGYKQGNDEVNSVTLPYLHRGKKISRKLVFEHLEDLKNSGLFPDIKLFFFENSETCEQIRNKYIIGDVQILIYSIDIDDNYYKETIWLRQ